MQGHALTPAAAFTSGHRSTIASTTGLTREVSGSLIHGIFLVAVLFPYVQVVPIGTDVQPVALCLAVVSLLFSQRWLGAPRELWLLGVLFIVATFVFLTGEIAFEAVRSVGDYASLFLISLASFSCARDLRKLTIRLLIVAIWTWFIVAVIQSLLSDEFLYQILPAVRRSSTRGVVSLAPEPGYYATMCLFFLLMLFLFKREQSIHGLLCIVQVTLLARSTLFTVILAIAMLLYGLIHLSPKKMFIVAALLLSGWGLATQTNFFDNTRIGDLAKLALVKPLALTKLDLSISDRVAHLVFSLKGTLDNHFLPNGFTSWGNYYHSETVSAHDYFLDYYPDPYPKRIQSGIGAPFYELGLFGAIQVWALIAGIRHRFGSLRSRSAIFFGASLGLCILPGTPIATPIYGFILGHLFACREAMPQAAGREN
jgi:hypothetical protein